MVCILSAKDPPRNAYQPVWTHQLRVAPDLSSLPPCIGRNILNDMLALKCWPPVLSPTRYPQYAPGPDDLPPCAGKDIWEDTKALLDGKCGLARSR